MASVSSDFQRHNAQQLHYFESATRKGMWPSHSHYVSRQVDEVLRAAAAGPGDRVLEAGCGMGRHTLEVARRGLSVEALDLSAVMLTQLAEIDGGRYGVTLHQGDVLAPPTELEGRFDAVLGFFILHHLPDVQAGLTALARLVRPGGRLAFIEPNPLHPLYYVQMVAAPDYSWEGERGILNMSEARMAVSMEGAGLRMEPVSRFGFLPPPVVNRPRGRTLEGLFEALPGASKVKAFQVLAGVRPG
jgi:2-polyprenyl-3-methyl-5-hydroxy-6-metoxy-1,4-benzoquinol methylase